jgi:hypothetical protein
MSLQSAYKQIGETINKEIVKQMDMQGHRMTGAFEESLEVIHDFSSVSGIGNTYGIYLNIGVKAEQIKYPYARARIAGLTRFVEHRMGLSGKDATGVAYAIATVHAREGMPTRGSYQYSNNGKRTDMIDDAIEVVEPEIIEILFEAFKNVIDVSTKVTGR